MAAVIAYRGPDDAGVWCDPEAGLALSHRRLAILDLSPAGHQPMPSPTGRYVIAFNGEIYNHLALRRDLGAAGAATALARLFRHRNTAGCHRGLGSGDHPPAQHRHVRHRPLGSPREPAAAGSRPIRRKASLLRILGSWSRSGPDLWVGAGCSACLSRLQQHDRSPGPRLIASLHGDYGALLYLCRYPPVAAGPSA